MSDPQTDAYRDEIVDYLLGRLQPTRAQTAARPAMARLDDAPALWWWILEGHRHALFDGPLLWHLGDVLRRARRLLSSFSQRRQILHRPEGRVRWLASAHASVGSARPRYVCEVASAGLGDAERIALMGWCDWLAAGIRGFAGLLDEQTLRRIEPDVLALERLGAPLHCQHDHGVRRRWAHTARRSRWPLLREVVADSLRAESTPIQIERLPLPADRATVFELLCLVRALKVLAPAPRRLRWLVQGQNRIAVDGLHATFQRSFRAQELTAAMRLSPVAGAAMTVFAVRQPKITDLILHFEAPRNGFDGVLIEAKSGGVQYRDAVWQLQVYRRALEAIRPRRMLVMGVSENPNQGRLTPEQLEWIGSHAATPGDVWAFCGAADIAGVLKSAGLSVGLGSGLSTRPSGPPARP